MIDLKKWLPINKKELKIRNWEEVDVIIISGDAYVDHPSFGHALIGRLIENEGFRVAILAQPNWRDDLRDFKKLGKPKLFFGITSGAMDSMVNHYTAFKRLRSDDAYTAGNVSGFRPDYAATIYSQIVKRLFPDSLVILGGVEASLRRFTHYDYWSNSLLPPILAESKADLLVYGMGEKPILEILNVFKNKPNPNINDFKDVPQICYLSNNSHEEGLLLHSHEDCLQSKENFAENFKIIETESNKINAKKIIQAINNQFLIVNPPAALMTSSELDAVYDLPFTRLPHPSYSKRGEIPAFTMINCSVNIHRGCFGGCSFCSISMHQGKFITNRSEKSILKEVEKISKMPYFKGFITDLGGPSANMYRMQGIQTDICRKCSRPSCIYPSICSNLNFNHQPLLSLYRKAKQINAIKKITIGSGIRYDMLQFKQKDKTYHLEEYTKELICNHVSGRLKVAPEHTENHVLKLVRKPSYTNFLAFKKTFDTINETYQLKQQLIPYFISSLPGCNLNDMKALSLKIKNLNYHLEQVQDFTPTPMTLSSVIFYTGINPYTKEKVFCETNIQKKREQNSFFFKKSKK